MLAFSLGVVASGPALGQEHGQPTRDATIANVESALARIPAEGKLLKFTGTPPVARGGHCQGIQLAFDAARNRHVAFLSHDSETIAYVVILEFPADLAADGRVLHVHAFPSDGRSPPLRHAGGIQLLDNILVVGLEDNQQKTRSEIQFWDVSNPATPSPLAHLTIRRAGAPKEKTAGAVGIVARDHDHLLAVANWDSRAIDFYVSNGKPLDDPKCRFELHGSWQSDRAEKNDWRPNSEVGAYQAVNLVSDAHRNLFLVGFETSPAGKDFVDLFSIELAQAPARALRKLAHKPMQLPGENHFRYSGGLWIERDRLTILSSQRDLGREGHISIAAPAR